MSRSSPDTRRASLWSSAGRGRLAALALLGAATGGLALGLVLPIVRLREGLSSEDYSILAGIADLAEDGNLLLALLVLAFSFVFPIAKLVSLFAILFVPLAAGGRAGLLRRLTILGRWSMLDVFVIVILVSSIRLGVLSDGSPRPGIYVFTAAVVASMVATMTLSGLAGLGDRAVERAAARGRDRLGGWTAAGAGLVFAVGLVLPLMRVEKWLFWDNDYSVLSGAWQLAREGEAFLAGVVLLFVGVLPLARFAALAWLRWDVRSERAARWAAFVDEWAMLDVFGLALLIVLVKIGEIATVEPRPGLWVLLVAVAATLWDSWRLRSREHA